MKMHVIPVAQAKEAVHFFKFAAVGASGTVVNLGLLALLSNFEVGVALAAGIAIEASILWNFTWNDKWTFITFTRLGRWLRWWQRCWRYHLIVGAGALVNYGLVLVFGPAIGVVPAGVAGIALACLWNYGASRALIYQGRE